MQLTIAMPGEGVQQELPLPPEFMDELPEDTTLQPASDGYYYVMYWIYKPWYSNEEAGPVVRFDNAFDAWDYIVDDPITITECPEDMLEYAWGIIDAKDWDPDLWEFVMNRGSRYN